jgi:hypothetical protein
VVYNVLIGPTCQEGAPMISVEMRFEAKRRQDLAWLVHTSQELHEIHMFLARAYVESEFDQEVTAFVSRSDRKQFVTERTARIGAPIVRVRQGSLLLELSEFVDSTTGVQILAGLAVLFKKGPEAAAWPHRVLEAWYSSGKRAKKARNAYRRIQKSSIVEVVEEVSPAPEKTAKRARRARRVTVTEEIADPEVPSVSATMRRKY